MKMAGGSRIVINDEGITISTGGKILYQAQQHKFEGGKKVASIATFLPTLIPHEESQQFRVVDENNNPRADIEYLILDKNNQAYMGKTDKEGLTKRVSYSKKNELQFFYGAEAIEKIEELELG
ncbi:hypothetical protein ABSDF_p20022 (plasmid) [Acinetobacter baumannii SDF]|uniref:DUF2345 domain-containing protein n=1 Tax=Acinetobacter baumannii (strain SDF) TaxID=509170 RepID=B0VVD4_ACIBS|nr:hypothetical protein ABSDF_p20022 [Acinetobacter baumannii SDF]